METWGSDRLAEQCEQAFDAIPGHGDVRASRPVEVVPPDGDLPLLVLHVVEPWDGERWGRMGRRRHSPLPR